MARTPSKTGSTTASGTAKPRIAKPQTVQPAASTKAVKKPAPPKAIKTAPAAKPASKLASARAAKPAKVVKPEKKAGRKSLLQEASTTITKLASDIVADRIIPTIDQIKAVAESLLSLDRSKSKKSKKKKK